MVGWMCYLQWKYTHTDMISKHSASHVTDISCASVTVCYVTASLSGNHGPQFVVFRTADGGATWSTETGIDTLVKTGSTNSPSEFGLGRLACPLVSTCFVSAASVVYGVNPGAPSETSDHIPLIAGQPTPGSGAGQE